MASSANAKFLTIVSECLETLRRLLVSGPLQHIVPQALLGTGEVEVHSQWMEGTIIEIIIREAQNEVRDFQPGRV